MKYKILESRSISLLEELVNMYIRNGWRPLGGVSHNGNESYFKYSQAVVKDN